MKKQLLLLFFFPLFSFSLTDWISFPLDEHASVSFPTAPEKVESGSYPVWTSKGEGISCMAMSIDFASFGMDSAMVATEMVKPEQANAFRDGLLGKLPGASMMSEKISTTNGLLTYEYVIDLGKKESDLNIMYNKNIFVGSKMYSLSVYEKYGSVQAEPRNMFLNSLKIKP